MYISLTSQPLNLMDGITSSQIAKAISDVSAANIPFLQGEVFAYTVMGEACPFRASVQFVELMGAGVQMIFKTAHEESTYQWLLGSYQVLPLNSSVVSSGGIKQTLNGIDRVNLVNQALLEVIGRHMRMAGLRR